MTITVTPTESQIFTALRTWLLTIVPAGVEVIGAFNNRVPEPAGEYVMMSPATKERLSTDVIEYTDSPELLPPVELKSFSQSAQINIQVDCYGTTSGDWTDAMTTLFRSEAGVEAFASSSLTPLWHDQPQHIALVDGEEQYEHRWMTVLHFQVTYTVNTSAQFMDEVTVKTVNVDTLPL